MINDELFRGPHLRTLDQAREVEVRRAEVHSLLSEHLVDDPEVKKIIDSIDFEAVQEIYSGLLERVTGKNSVSAHIVPRVDIILTNDVGIEKLESVHADTSMSYIPDAEVIVVNVDKVRADAPVGVPFSLYVTHLLNHEQGHATDAHYKRTARSGHTVEQVGLEQWQYNAKADDPEATPLHRLIGEGVNERRARWVTREYFRNNTIDRVTSSDLAAMDNIYTAPDLNSVSMLCSLHLVNTITKKIAREIPMPEEMVFNGFIHAMMMGLDLENQKARGPLNYLLAPKFIESLSRASADEVPPILQEAGLTDSFEKFGRRLAFIIGELDRQGKLK